MQINRLARYIVTLVVGLMGICSPLCLQAQELEAKVVVNHSKIQGTNNSVFTTLQEAMTEFLNTRKWTNSQYTAQERIACSFNLIVNEYSDEGRFGCSLMVQANRPVYNASYNTTVLNFNDNAVDFSYIEHDKLEYSDDIIDNNLTAVLAYYAYLIIGLDMDTFAPKGGTDILHKAENVVNNAQMLGEDGWKAFGDSKNRHAIVNDHTASSSTTTIARGSTKWRRMPSVDAAISPLRSPSSRRPSKTSPCLYCPSSSLRSRRMNSRASIAKVPPRRRRRYAASSHS